MLYRNGFWEIPFLSNSPELIVKSVMKMPFTKHDKRRNQITSKTPLIKGGFYYEEIEKGIWLIYSKLAYQANINYMKSGDGDKSHEWYLLNLTVFGVRQKVALINDVPHTNCSWTLRKPNTWSTNCHFKGAEEHSLTLYIHRDWFKSVPKTMKAFKESTIQHFFESDSEYELWEDSLANIKPFYQPLIDNFENSEERNDASSAELKEQVYHLLEHFFENYQSNSISKGHFKVPDKMRIAMYRIEKLLLERLSEPFPGIDFLTKEAGISETSLKVNFKLMFGISTRQYFQQKQMYLAKQILLSESIKISQLATRMGYQNHSKFSAAFKKHNAILPSDILTSSN
jgi:AraC-like DNA-binding protein